MSHCRICVVNNDLHIVICMVVGAGVVKERNIFTSNENNVGSCKFQLHWLGLSKSSWWVNGESAGDIFLHSSDPFFLCAV